MSDSPKLLALRKSLAEASDGAAPEDSKKLAHAAIAQILMAIESGVCPLGDWERRCLRGGDHQPARRQDQRGAHPRAPGPVAR